MKYLCILFLLLFSFSAIGNNIRVEGKTRVVEFLGNDTAVVEVTLLWDNSWRDDFNWDAAWVFFKYKKREMSEGWKHVYLGRDGHEAAPLSGNEGGNYTFMFGEAGVGSNAKVTGLYVIRDEISEGKVKARLRVKWPLSTNGLTKSDFGENMDQYYIAVHAIEMVYIPYGAYSLGDGFSGKSFVSSEKEPLTIDSEDARSVYTLSSPSTPLSLSSSYPKGYAGFYVMKYEVSQEQYVEFLNSLTLSQQKSRVGNNDFEHMEKGDYVFGDLKRPNCRNGIAFISQPRKKGPVVFGNNLDPENDFFSVDDGQTLACNYLSPSDMLAYCDWSGLRPMSELEYEKACRRPYPQVPEKGEYAWNTSSGVNSLQSESELSYRWSENEQAVSKQKNVNSGGHVNGPVRCGLFGNSQTSQSESGATYWGVMDMGGNLWEMCYNAEGAGSKFVGNDFSYSHGDGVLDAGGNTDISASYWPFVVGAIGVRGGSFSSVDSLLRTSDRSYAIGTYFASFTTRDSSVGFRGVRGVLNTTGFTAGIIYGENGLLQDTICALTTSYRIQGLPANKTVGKVTYSWYVSEDEGITWSMVENANDMELDDTQVSNTTTAAKTYLFKRKAVCAVGEETTNEVRIIVRPPVHEPLIATEILAGLKYRFQFPCFEDDSITSVWQFPDGGEKTGPNVYIDSYQPKDDGIYYIHSKDLFGCASNKVAVNIKGIPEGIPIVDYGKYKGWADGTYAKSALAYLHPTSPYVYLGSTGSGYYKMKPENEAFEVYCDMETDGGGWMMILDKDKDRHSWQELEDKWGFKKTSECYYYEGVNSDGYYWGYWSNYYANKKYNSSASCNWGWNCNDTYAYDWNVRKLPHSEMKISVLVSVNSNALGRLILYDGNLQALWTVSDSQAASNSWSSPCGTLYKNQVCTGIISNSNNVYRIKSHYYSSGYNGNRAYLRFIYIR